MARPSEEPTQPTDAVGGSGDLPEPGKRWGKFLIERQLGSGGQAVVFQAFDQIGTAGHVALKVPLGRVPPEALQQWIDSEAGALVKLRHPNVVPVLEAGEVNGVPYVATRLVEGLPLHEYVRTHPPSPKLMARWTAELADALHAAHERGIIHRDLKPLNVIVTTEGRPVIIDFGVASLVTPYRPETRSDASGTFAFMAPEQARGDPGAGHRVDIFSLGAILKFLLAGRGPYEGAGSLVEVIERARAGLVTPVPLTGLSGLRRALARIANRAIQPDPGSRFPTALHMASAIRRATRWPVIIGACLTAVMAVAVGFVALRTFGKSESQQPQEPALSGEAVSSPSGQTRVQVLFRRAIGDAPFRVLTADDLPLLEGDWVLVQADSPVPLYWCVILLPQEGEAQVLYHHGPNGQPVRQVQVPDGGWQVTGPSGTVTAIALGRREPFQPAEQIASKLSTPGIAPRLMGRVLLQGGKDGVKFQQGALPGVGVSTGPVAVEQRGLEQALMRLAQQCEVVRAVAFPVRRPGEGGLRRLPPAARKRLLERMEKPGPTEHPPGPLPRRRPALPLVPPPPTK